jgi:hypothetical protein
LATLVTVEEVKDNLPMSLPSAAGDTLIQSYVDQAEGRVTVELNGLPEPDTDDARLMASVVRDLATARSILKFFGRDPEMVRNARELREVSERTIQAFREGGETPSEVAADDADDELAYSDFADDYLFDFRQVPTSELAED